MSNRKPPDKIDKAIAATEAKEQPHGRYRMEIPLPSGHGALFDIPYPPSALDALTMIVALVRLLTGEVAAEKQEPPKGALLTPSGIHLVR